MQLRFQIISILFHTGVGPEKICSDVTDMSSANKHILACYCRASAHISEIIHTYSLTIASTRFYDMTTATARWRRERVNWAWLVLVVRVKK